MVPVWKDIDHLAQPVDHVPAGKEEKDKGHGESEIVVLSKEPFEPSGYNALEKEVEHIPGKPDWDANIMQWSEENLRKEIAEAFLTPDAGISNWSNSLYFGGAAEIGDQNKRNFCPDPIPPEELGPYQGDQDPSNTLVAKQNFVPQEENLSVKITKMLETKFR